MANDAADLRLFGGSAFSSVGSRAAVKPCKCNGGIVRANPQFTTTGGVGDGSESFGVKPSDMWPQSVGDGPDAIINTGVVTKKVQAFYGTPRPDVRGMLLQPQAMHGSGINCGPQCPPPCDCKCPGITNLLAQSLGSPAFGPVTVIPKFPPGYTGTVTGSVPIDKRTQLYHYGVV